MDKYCLGYLKRAADANTVSVAHRELSKALKYLESKKLITGYTSVIYTTPDEDIGFWYTNIKAAQDELVSVMKNPKSTPLERSNVLMKLRETLLDKSGGNDKLTYPHGIAWYPHNSVYAFVYTVFILIASISLIKLSNK